MKKAQEKVEPQTRSKVTATATEALAASVSNSPASSSSSTTNRRMPYTSIRNVLSQSRKSESRDRDIDKTDSGKKKNRRKERKTKATLKEAEPAKSSYSPTPQCSPSISKPRRSSTSNIFTPSKSPIMHKPSAKKDKSREIASSNLTEPRFTFIIQSVTKPQCGQYFRKRNKKQKYIQLKNFLNLTSKTCIFETNLAQLSRAFNMLSLGPKHKNKNRKYYKSDFSSSDLHVNRQRIVTQHSEMLLSRTETDRAGHEVVESVLVVQDSSIQAKDGPVQDTPKRIRRPKKERHRTKQRLEKKQAKEASEVFPPYVSEEVARAGIASGELIKGFLRVNPKNSRDAYVSNADSTLSDYNLVSVADRNRALDGDEVVLRLKPEAEWLDGKKTAVVVFILNKIHPRTTVGNLKPLSDDPGYATFYPRDKRMPVMRIPLVTCPNGFRHNPRAFENIIFVGQLLDWPHPRIAEGVIIDTLGLSGDLSVETKSILKEFCLDVTPFSQEMLQCLPKSKTIPAEEFKCRDDIRKQCVFTIDPLTARDLDDAVSVIELPNRHYEVGVHISDASFYLSEGTPLDEMVSSKATTIYLVDSVYHMLPVELCLHCSLLPGDDKLAFSVFWEMDEKGEIYNTRFARTVLNSCAQLAYEHAQQMIEDPDREFKAGELPDILNGFTAKDLSKTVNILKKIALNLREARIRNGSLRIDQVKLLFSVNPRNGEPLDFIVYENKESHRLIEEFMLLANISVAQKINQSFPDIAFLRCHETPKYTMLVEAQKTLETCGIHVDISSSGGIHSSLRKYITDDYQGFCRGIVLNHIFAKPMTRARYFCAGTMDCEENFPHYALSVPIYTHFTSPIRRYADIMVHRLLAASLGYADKPKWNLDHVISIAANCNKQKYNAKRAGEASSDLYLAHYIEKNQPYIQDCVVIDVKDHSFDAIVLKTGSIVRVYQKKCEDNPTWTVEGIPTGTTSTPAGSKNDYEHNKKVYRLTIEFPKTKRGLEPCKMLVEMFSVVKVKLKRIPNSYKLEASLLRPVQTRTFQRSDSNRATNT